MYFTRSFPVFKVSVASAANMEASIPPIPPAAYIFIISCIRLPSSESVRIEEISAFFSFSTLIFNLSLPSALWKVSVRLSAAAFKSSSGTSSFKDSVTSASIRMNLYWSFLRSSWEMKEVSMLWFKITASMFCSLKSLMYCPCCASSVT